MLNFHPSVDCDQADSICGGDAGEAKKTFADWDDDNNWHIWKIHSSAGGPSPALSGAVTPATVREG